MSGFLLSYRGFIADQHQLDLRRFGYALVGLDHLISTGIIGLTEFRFPKGRERIDLTIVAEPPREGSVEIVGTLLSAHQALQPAFPFLLDLLKSKAPDLIWDWLSAVFKWHGGRKEEAEPHIERLTQVVERLSSDIHKDRQNEREFILELVDSVKPNAAKVARPVGDSSKTLSLPSPITGEETVIDSAMAAAIRSKEDLKVSELKEIEVFIDGFTNHSSLGTIAFIEDPEAYHYAKITDPLVNVKGNPYTEALHNRSPIKVLARITYKADAVHRVFVLSVLGEEGFHSAA
ncbi:MAG: hypothetical protein AAFR64_10125 [Pseudomonadota bacterium]